jgi:hypothetical protein
MPIRIPRGQRLDALVVLVPFWMRAPGVAPGMFTGESTVDELALACGLDPIRHPHPQPADHRPTNTFADRSTHPYRSGGVSTLASPGSRSVDLLARQCYVASMNSASAMSSIPISERGSSPDSERHTDSCHRFQKSAKRARHCSLCWSRRRCWVSGGNADATKKQSSEYDRRRERTNDYFSHGVPNPSSHLRVPRTLLEYNNETSRTTRPYHPGPTYGGTDINSRHVL